MNFVKSFYARVFCVFLLTGLIAPAHSQLDSAKITPVVSLLLLSEESPKTDLIINEIDYDQIGIPDSEEFIELLNTGNGSINLAGLAVILIDGDTNAEYARIDLSSQNTIAAGQYLVIASPNISSSIPAGAKIIDFSMADANIQNGWGGGAEGGTFPLGDAIILFDVAADELLSGHAFEGDITGAIINDSSTTITLVSSLQDTTSNMDDGSVARIPNGQNTGSETADFRFPATPTPGSVNRFTKGLIVNEVDYDMPLTDDSEFIEIYNKQSFPIDLSGVSIVRTNGDGAGNGAEYSTRIDLDSLQSLDGESYLVAGASSVIATLDASIKTLAFDQAENNIQNGQQDAIVLFDRVTGTVVSSASYEGGTTNATIDGQAGYNLVHGTAMTAVDPGNTAPGSIARLPNGTTSGDDDNDWSAISIPTPGAANASYATLVINEIDYNQPLEDTTEFIEIYNKGSAALDLSGVSLILVNGTTSTEYDRYDLSSLGTLAANSLAVIGSATVVAGLPPGVPAITTIGPIQNGPDGVALFNTDYEVLIDALSYDSPFINAAVFNGVSGTFDLVSGTGAAAIDSNIVSGSMQRSPDGQKTGNDDSDWIFNGPSTPGNFEN